MSLTSADNMIDFLRRRLHQYAEMVSQQCALGFTDEAKKAETFYKHLFNCLEFQFENMNGSANNPLAERPDDFPPGSINYPAIDLGDTTNRVAIQVSFQRDNQAQKLERTYAKFLKQEFQSQYDKLMVLFPTATLHTVPLFDQIDYPGVKLHVITHEDVLQALVDKYPLRIEQTYEFVRYWLDGQLPEGGTFVWRDEFEMVLRYDELLRNIRYPFAPYANVQREKVQRYLETVYCDSVRDFVHARRSTSQRPGGHLALYPFLREFRELEQRVDSLAQDLSAKFFGSLYTPMERWQRLPYPEQNIMGFMHHAWRLDKEQTEHCELIGRQIYLLIQLIGEHREMIRNARPLPGQII